MVLSSIVADRYFISFLFSNIALWIFESLYFLNHNTPLLSRVPKKEINMANV